jgi:hypothetical protein
VLQALLAVNRNSNEIALFLVKTPPARPGAGAVALAGTE